MNSEEVKAAQLFEEGSSCRAYQWFGAHPAMQGKTSGVRFTVWAPEVKRVSVVGEFNRWQADQDNLFPVGESGVWSGFIPGLGEGTLYKYLIETENGETFYKADPFAFYSQLRPETASVVHGLDYRWHDARWLSGRKRRNHFQRPKNIYEVHPGSWRRHLSGSGAGDEEGHGSYYTYRELAEELVPYVREMGYTYIELMPLMEHPFDGSWGYQTTGYYSATSRYGTPQDLMYLVDTCHQAGIGVIFDWTPGHFCRDDHGLRRWNGRMLYEKGDHPQWGTCKFDYGRGGVRSFLLSNAVFWLEMFHADGLRVDGVTSMLYLNFGVDRPEEKQYNERGTEEDLQAIAFLQEFSRLVGQQFPDVFLAAEESSAWPLVTYPPEDGGLGFHYKWDMGWMNDTLRYLSTDFPYRPGCHQLLTFSMMYAFQENFLLPLSHDEVVHGKCSLIGRMPGDYWRKFAGLRLLALYQATHPGGMLNFMGSEFGQFIEWRYYEQLEWFLLDYEAHRKHREFIKALNHIYVQKPALWSCDRQWSGFQWIDADNNSQCVLSFVRISAGGRASALVVLNFDVQTFYGYRVGVPKPGYYQEILSSDAEDFGGSGKVNPALVKAEKIPYHGQPYSIEITVPPIGGAIFIRKTVREDKAKCSREKKNSKTNMYGA